MKPQEKSKKFKRILLHANIQTKVKGNHIQRENNYPQNKLQLKILNS